MSRSSISWVIAIVVLGILIGIVGGGIMGGLAGMYLARSMPASAAVPLAQPVKAVTENQPPIIQNLSVNADTQIIEAVRKVEPAVVTIVTNVGGIGFGIQGSGSGVIISKEGHVVTNYHVIEGANNVTIIYSDGGRVNPTIVGVDPVTDIAVLKVNGEVPAWVEFGDSSALQLGEWVIAIGSPLGNYRGSVTVGVISGMNRRVPGTNQENLLQTDAAINHGNSGGPLVNLAGQIVGINTLVVRDTVNGSPAEGLGFAVPSNTVRQVVEQLIARGRIDYPFIGITYTEVTPQIASQLDLRAKNGVVVTQVTPGSPAARAGIQPRDVILAINNDQIDESHTLRSILFKYRVGDQVTLTIERAGREMKIQLVLVARPS